MKLQWKRAGGALSAATALVACGDPPSDTNPEYLLMKPERLAQLRTECRLDPSLELTPVCRAVIEATRRRFMGSGTPYTPINPTLPTDPGASP